MHFFFLDRGNLPWYKEGMNNNIDPNAAADADTLNESRDMAIEMCRSALEEGTLDYNEFDDILLDAGFDGDPIDILDGLI